MKTTRFVEPQRSTSHLTRREFLAASSIATGAVALGGGARAALHAPAAASPRGDAEAGPEARFARYFAGRKGRAQTGMRPCQPWNLISRPGDDKGEAVLQRDPASAL